MVNRDGLTYEPRRVGTVVRDLGYPLRCNVLERVGVGDGETDEKDVRFGVGERPQAILQIDKPHVG